jgi:hypothetical protein
MSYTVKQIDKMSIEEIESLAEMLNDEDKNKWASSGYSGDSYVEIIKSR